MKFFRKTIINLLICIFLVVSIVGILILSIISTYGQENYYANEIQDKLPASFNLNMQDDGSYLGQLSEDMEIEFGLKEGHEELFENMRIILKNKIESVLIVVLLMFCPILLGFLLDSNDTREKLNKWGNVIAFTGILICLFYFGLAYINGRLIDQFVEIEAIKTTVKTLSEPIIRSTIIISFALSVLGFLLKFSKYSIKKF